MAIKKIENNNDVNNAATEALRTIAIAAAEATKVVASAAAEAAKVINAKGAIDHDLLIELKTRMESLKDDIRDLKDGTTVKISDHETRLFALESSRGKQSTLLTVGIGILLALLGLLTWHLFGVKI
jgi:N12 class adenine-specific DNA methylase